MRAALSLIFLLASVYLAHASDRVALVIGNGAYGEAVGALANPENDATAIATRLEELGFEVVVGIDLTAAQQTSAVVDFAEKSKGAKVVLFYYSGHGMQIDGRNYIIPVDADPANPAEFDFKILDVARVFAYMQAQDRVALAFLDACRDNPFRKFTRTGAKSLATDRGLAAPQIDGTGLFVGFATAPGDVALDGDSNHSPFTEAMLKHIGTAGLEINQVMTKVKADVVLATNNEQRPWAASDLTGDVVLVPEVDTAEERLWQKVLAEPTEALLNAFKDTFPTSGRLAEVEALLASLETTNQGVAVEPAGNPTTELELKANVLTTGDRLVLAATVPTPCQPSFFDVATASQITPFPNELFGKGNSKGGRTTFDTRLATNAIEVTPEDARGEHLVGFLCSLDGPLAGDDQKLVLREVYSRLKQGEMLGTLPGNVLYHFVGYTIR